MIRKHSVSLIFEPRKGVVTESRAVETALFNVLEGAAVSNSVDDQLNIIIDLNGTPVIGSTFIGILGQASMKPYVGQVSILNASPRVIDTAGLYGHGGPDSKLKCFPLFSNSKTEVIIEDGGNERAS